MTALLLVSSLVACSQERKPENPEVPEPLPDQPIREPTFEAILSPSELMGRVRDNLPSAVDTPEEIQAIAELQEELSKYRYVPSPEVVTPDGPEEPLGDSFMDDAAMMDNRVAQIFSGTVMVSCILDPCNYYGDFDGDGRRDIVVQVLKRGSYQAGIVFLLSNGMYAVIGAGRASEVGADLLWAMVWRRVPAGTEGGAAEALFLEGLAEKASVQLGASREDGSVEVVARWIGAPPPPLE